MATLLLSIVDKYLGGLWNCLALLNFCWHIVILSRFFSFWSHCCWNCVVRSRNVRFFLIKACNASGVCLSLQWISNVCVFGAQPRCSVSLDKNRVSGHHCYPCFRYLRTSLVLRNSYLLAMFAEKLFFGLVVSWILVHLLNRSHQLLLGDLAIARHSFSQAFLMSVIKPTTIVITLVTKV